MVDQGLARVIIPKDVVRFISFRELKAFEGHIP
jgi:hypothetical protein